LPISGISTEPQLSAAQCTRPLKKSAVTTPSTNNEIAHTKKNAYTNHIDYGSSYSYPTLYKLIEQNNTPGGVHITHRIAENRKNTIQQCYGSLDTEL
jgi:hypothetical protein